VDSRPLRESVRTDLALELLEGRREIPGVRVSEERSGDVLLTRIEVLDAVGALHVGKVPGRYVTIEAPALRTRSRETQDRVVELLARELPHLLPADPEATVFVVGLGNWRATPDALGPRVVEHLLVTRHLWAATPSDLRGRLRPVCALAPGVLGITGIETGEIIRAVVERIRPAAVVAVDALAARSLHRILTTIQLADTGIHPGSGVGNRRLAVTPETIGVPTIAIGIPTVVHAHTIAYDTVDILVQKLAATQRFYQLISGMTAEDKRALIAEVLSAEVGDLMVTPKEIDVFIDELAQVVAEGLNRALHPQASAEDRAGTTEP
jgi:spore protease